MKNYLTYALIGVVVASGVVGIFIFRNKIKPKWNAQTISQTSLPLGESGQANYRSLFGDEPNVCEIFPKEKIEELSGKGVVAVEQKPHKELDFSQYLCLYYQEPAKYSEISKVNIAKNISVGVVVGKKEIERSQEGYKMLKYTTKEDKDIPFNHLLVYDEKGKFHHLDLLLADDYKLTLETWWSLLSEDEALEFAKRFALFFEDLAKEGGKISVSSNQAVPLPQSEDIVRTFAELIDEGKADEAARMMKTSDASPLQANSELQAWAVQFASIKSFKLLKIEKANESEWTDTKHIYKIIVDVLTDPSSANAPIPYYGWENGQNTRWLTLEKVDNLWKIAEISTGP